MATIHYKEINDIDAPELELYVRYSEAQLLHYREPNFGVFTAESPNVIMRALEAGYEPLSFLIDIERLTPPEENLIKKYPDVPVYSIPNAILKEKAKFQLIRGMLCAMNRRVLPGLDEVCAGARRIVLLEDVVNPTNVGAIFRSAAALGMDAVILTPGCSDPLYKRASRVSMGTVFQVPWTILGRFGTLAKDAIPYLREHGYKIASMALKKESVSLDDPVLKQAERLAVIMGTEGNGLKDETIDTCDYTIKIPMAHGVDSLNVAAASAVAFWELSK